MRRIGAHLPAGTGRRIIRWAMCSVALTVTVAACGSSGSTSTTHSTPAAAATAPATSTSTPATTSTAKHHPKAKGSAHPSKKKSSGGTAASTTSSTTSTPTSSSSTPTSSSSTPTTTHPAGSGSKKKKKTSTPPAPKPKPKPKPAPKPAPLARPVVTATSGGVHASLHAVNHTPKIGTLWNYQVLVTDASGHALSGTTLTEYVFMGTVVGRESPPKHRLKNGRLSDNITYPARSAGVPLTMRVVVHTPAGTVTLNWPVKAHR